MFDVISRQVFAHHGALLLTFTQAAAEVGLSLRTIQRLVSSGAIKAVQVDTGKGHAPTRRIRREDLAEYVDSLAPAS